MPLIMAAQRSNNKCPATGQVMRHPPHHSHLKHHITVIYNLYSVPSPLPHTFLSRRPGRSNAGSRTSGRFVAMIILTCVAWHSPGPLPVGVQSVFATPHNPPVCALFTWPSASTQAAGVEARN
jgi:hypothetical protein